MPLAKNKQNKPNKVPVSYTLEPDLRDGIIQEAERQDMDSASSLVRRIFKNYLKKRPTEKLNE